jgi:hypothetical protein
MVVRPLKYAALPSTTIKVLSEVELMGASKYDKYPIKTAGR